ncbi:MAG: inositol monophosphatase family protein [Ilumatobacteraceae bacterium]
MTRSVSDDLAFALSLADDVDAYTLPRFEAADFTLGWKDDRTEVTEADRGAELLLAARVLDQRPDDAFFGEEHGIQGAPDSPWRWIVDPIDGTSGFVRGIPVWATLIALTHPDHGVSVAVVSAPALRHRWWASAGHGAFVDGRQCHVSDVTDLASAQVSVTFNSGWDELGLTGELVAIVHEARRARGFGDFWQHCLVAEGALDLAVDAVGVATYDIAAVRLIVEEAGGTFTDRFGTATHEQPTAISSNGALHARIIARLGR